jgi:hypothetical protein
MADVERWRYEDAKHRVGYCFGNRAIEIGDLVILEGFHGNNMRLEPAAQTPDQGSLAANQEYFADRFLGVAQDAHRASQDPADNTRLKVSTAGVHEFICPTGAMELGDYVGVDENADGDGLLNQTVEYLPRTEPERAIGVVAERKPAGQLTVFVEIFPRAVGRGIATKWSEESVSGSSSSE